jgi:hypothetical protein
VTIASLSYKLKLDVTKVLKSTHLGVLVALAGCAASPTWAADLLQLTAQGKSFTLTAATTVSYGANNVFAQKTLQPGTYSCSDGFFGDPLPGVVKACFVPNPTTTPQLQQLGKQDGSFTLSKTTVVSYGANNTFNQKTLAAGTYSCTDAFFGDPIWGVVKGCYAPADTTQPTKIVGQSGSFTLATASVVSYGANGVFFQKTLQPGTYSCNDSFFGDPLSGVVKACYTSTSTAIAKPVEPPPLVKPPITPIYGAVPVPGDVVVNGAVSNAEYQAMAQKMGTDAGIAYRYGSPSTLPLPGVTYPGPRPDKSYLSTSVQRGERGIDGVVGTRGCGRDGFCGDYQIGNHIGDPRDYSSNIINVAYVPDTTATGWPEAKYWGVGSFQQFGVNHNSISWKPEPSWTTWTGVKADNGSNDENTRRLAGAASGSPVGTADLDQKPVAMTRGYGRSGWVNNVLTVFANGLITSAGSNTSHNFIKYRLPAGKTPTGIAISNSGEFAFVTVWDTTAMKGQLAVLALTEGCQWCETKPDSQWGGDWGNHRGRFPGMPGLGNFLDIKLVGFVDLPDTMKAPTEVAVTTGNDAGRDTGYQVIMNFWDQPLTDERIRKRIRDEDYQRAVSRTGMAVVLSKSEKKAAFIDLRPLFSYYRDQYLNTDVNGWNALLAKRGPNANQWPYSFEVAPAQRPNIIKVVSFDNRPTAVKMTLSSPHRAFIATEEGKLRTFDLGTGYLFQERAGGSPTDIRETFSIDVGANPTSIGYMKEKARHGPDQASLLFGAGKKEEQHWWVLSRGERKASLLQFNAEMTSATIFRTLQDSRLTDPIFLEDGDNHGTESYTVTFGNYSGKEIATYSYGPIVMWTHPFDGPFPAPCTKNAPCKPQNGQLFEYAGAQKLPGKPFHAGIANIN